MAQESPRNEQSPRNEHWELIFEYRRAEVMERFAVPGGWLYRNKIGADGQYLMTFVPTPPGDPAT